MGTPEFARTVAEYLLLEHEIVLIISQPDANRNRKKEWIYSPVKEFAIRNDIKLLQPEKVKDVAEEIMQTPADVIVTAAFGQILPKILLEHFPYKSINVHGSLLPKYRGGAPIQRAIINGDTMTGISIMYMKMKMDSGDILQQEAIPILPSDTQDSMFEKLAHLGGKLLLETLALLEKGLVQAVVQNEAEVTYAYNLTKADEVIDFSKSAQEVVNHIRGLNSNPGAYTLLDGEVLKIYGAKVTQDATNAQAGEILSWKNKEIRVSCGDGLQIAIEQLQLAGKKKMSASEFINGAGRTILKKGKKLGGPYEE